MPTLDPTNSDFRSRKAKKPTTVAGVIVAILIGGYALLRPAINEATGWNLPAPVAEVAPEERSQPKKPVIAPEKSKEPGLTVPAKKAESPESTKSPRAKNPSEKSPIAPKNPIAPTSPSVPKSPAPKPPPNARVSPAKPAAIAPATSDLLHGLLREIQPDRFISPAGLLYTPGGAEGHRLDHLERHTEDQPNRPGKHGVFDGGMEKALAVIDQAYEKAKAGVRTTKSTEDGRTVYTVDMGKRVGYIGGREGGQQRKPMARRIRMVLDGNRVITAFPM